MYKVILADDEKWALLSLSSLVDWADYQCEVVDTANDGVSAIEKSRRHHPDILFTDIRMPGMDGLELARIMAMELPDTCVILVTGYSDISYAQKALRIGAFDYLEKPVVAEDMECVLRRFLTHTGQRALKPTSQFFFSFFGDDNTRNVAACMRDLCIADDFTRVCAATALYDHQVQLPVPQIQENDDSVTIVFHTGSNQLTTFYLFREALTEEAAYAAIPEPQGAIAVGLSQVTSPESLFYEAYRQSTIAAETARFWHLSMPVRYQPGQRDSGQAAMELLRGRLLQGDHSLIAEALHELWQAAHGMMIDSLEKLVNQCIALLAAFHTSDESVLEMNDLQQLISSGGYCEDMLELLDSCLLTNAKQSGAPQLMEQVLRYIDQHFTSDLRITQVADYFHLNASYLSTLIRKYSGQTYSDIVTVKRMNYAKQLLRSSAMTTQEIAYRCGYHEYSHFNNLFKKSVGTTPAQYRKQENHQ